MSNVKKAFAEVVELLEANSEKKVATLMPQILELVSSKSMSKTFHKIDDNVVAVYCYYHKQWELVSEVEYGSKKGTATGLNTMCKDGVNAWSKQQREAKKEKDELLAQLASGEVPASELNDRLAEIEDRRKQVTGEVEGYETLDEALSNM